MAKLTTGARAKLAKSEFALPDKRAYPVNDRPHAANAKARATQAEKAGRMSAGTKAMIDAKANKVLAKGKPDPEEAAEDPAEEATETPAQEAVEEAAETPAKAAPKKAPAKKPPFMSASMTGVRAGKRNKATVI